MQLLRMLGLLLLLLSIALATGAPPAGAQALGEAELNALNARVIALYRASKYGEAIPLAERYAAAVKARYGGNSSEYAVAVNILAQLLKATNRLTKAGQLMRRALAIDEKAYGPSHPKVARDLNDLAQLHQTTNHFTTMQLLQRCEFCL